MAEEALANASGRLVLARVFSRPIGSVLRSEVADATDADQPRGVNMNRPGLHDDGKPAVLFMCVHNAGRSQMAMGFFQHLAGDAATAWSGGSEPAHEVNPAAVEAMAERGIDISHEFPKLWTDETVRAADVVITMGCGDTCPIYPGKRYEEWVLDDPAGLDVEQVRSVRNEIERRVRKLLDELGVAAGPAV
jgi:protein-tyrosine-phosphatase